MNSAETHIFKAFAQTASLYPSRPAILVKRNERYESLTYQQLSQSAIQLGNILMEQGVAPGNNVCLLLENQPEFSMAFFAVMYCGASAVPLDVQFSVQQVKQLILHAEARVLIVTEKIYPKIREELKDIKMMVVDSPLFKEELAKRSAENRFSGHAQGGNPLAVLFYTSGTSDVPKGVVLTHENLLANVNSIQQTGIVSQEDTVVSILPLHHAYSFTTTLLTPLLTGARIVYPPGLSSQDLLKCLQETQSTVFVGVPQIFSLMQRSIHQKMKSFSLLKRWIVGGLGSFLLMIRKAFHVNLSKHLFHDMHKVFGPKLRFMVSGGAKLDPEVAWDFFKWGFTLLEGYGLTETSPVVCFNTPGYWKIGSVGRVVAGVSVKILEADGQGVGEVAIKGPNVMAGYYHMSRETQEVVRDGWFTTGDLGYMDQDGFLFLVGRKKEIIILGNGKNIYPDEVERHYSQTPFIKEIAVLEAHESSGLGSQEHLAAIIVIDQDYFKTRNETNIQERLKWELDNISSQLPTYKRIKGFVIGQDALPRTRLGKIMRYKLRGVYEGLRQENRVKKEGSAPGPNGEQLSTLASTAISFLQKTFKRQINLKDHLELDLGLDSLGRVELLLNLQEHLKITMNDEEAMDFFMCNTIEELLGKLKKCAPENMDKPKEESATAWQEILNSDPQVKTLERIELRPGWFSSLVGIILICFIKILFRLFFFLRVGGKENLNHSGAFLVCPNHTSYLDGLFILSALPLKVAMRTYFVGLSEFFEHYLLRGLIKIARLIPMEASYSLVEALKTCSYVLRNAKIVCYFPEGLRSIDGEVKDFKKGVGILIKELQVPVVPVYIEGSFKTWSRGMRFPRLAPIKVRFGALFIPNIPNEEGKSADEVYEQLAGQLRNEVVKLGESAKKK